MTFQNKQSKYMKQTKVFGFQSGNYNISTFCWFREINNKYDTSNIDESSISRTGTSNKLMFLRTISGKYWVFEKY